MLNRIIVEGRLVATPELKTTRDGTPVCTITVAVERDHLAHGAERREVDFLDVVCWNHRAEFVSRYFTKGQLMVVEGRLQTRKWQDQHGQNRINYELLADNIYFAESKRETAPQSYGNTYQQEPTQTFKNSPEDLKRVADGFAEYDDDDDVPF